MHDSKPSASAFAALVLAGAALGQGATPLERDRLEAMMLSSQPETRAVAYATARAWGAAGRGEFRGILWAAWKRQELHFANALREGATSAGLFAASYRNWQALGVDAMASMRTGLDGSQARLLALDERFTEAENARAEVDARLAPTLEKMAQVASVGVALIELERVLAEVEGRDADRLPDVKTRLAESADGRAILAVEGTLLKARAARTTGLAAAAHNRQQKWAPPGTLRFAALLNRHRHVLGLGPLRMERQLWKACAMHAAEMQRVGYFDHESPSPERRTPGKRARIAHFAGAFIGENLYQSSRPEAAEQVFRSWWASDGHRAVLFANRPNALGVDPGGGTHWALMTGRL